MASIASACFSVKHRNFASASEPLNLNLIFDVSPCMRHAFASATFVLPRSISMIRSMQSTAVRSPILISLISSCCARSFLYFVSYRPYLKSVYTFSIFLSPMTSGLPLLMQLIFTPNVSSRAAFLYNILMMFCISSSEVPFFTSIHRHSPFLSPLSAISTTAGSSLFLTSSATVSRNLAVPPIIVYGSSVTQILFLPYPISLTSTLPRTLILPSPVAYTLYSSSGVALMIPPVAKSGPGMSASRSSSCISGSFRYATVASMTSPRLCVGIFVAIPTAIPVEPLTRIFGTWKGRKVGSVSVPSKFGMN